VSADGATTTSDFGSALAELMRAQGVSYRMLASRTSLSAGYLNHLVHGNRPVPANPVIERIAVALEVQPERFREYRLRVVTERLAELPELVDRLYRDIGGG
jgi:transcriptional regulator with XRE-family HTH domain